MATDHRHAELPESVVVAFTETLEAIENGDADRLRILLDAHPELVDAKTPSEPGNPDHGHTGGRLLHWTAGHPTGTHWPGT